MDHYYPNTAWLCLRRDVFDRLYRYKMQRGIPTWEQALECLLVASLRGGDAMNQALVDQIASAVLYEGYLLYPYRPSVKNRQRWTFGGLYPRSYSDQPGRHRPLGHADGMPGLDGTKQLGSSRVRVRFLHLQRPPDRAGSRSLRS